MTHQVALAVLLLSFFALFSLGVPLAVALLFASLATIGLDPGLDIIIVPMRVFSGINSFLLVAIPGFLFAAFMMNRIGVTEDIVAVSDLLVGRIRGGVAHVNIVANMLMGGVSGSSTADVAGIGGILIPVMNRKGYDQGFSAALTAAASSIGSIIPPSILMVIYGASANVSVGALFIAGYVPGILVGLQQLVIAYLYARKAGIGVVVQQRNRREIARILARGLVPLSVMVIIIGGIIGGVMTATESAAVASVYVVLLGLLVYRKLSWKMLMDVAAETARLTAIVMFCVGTATLFGWLMAFYDVLGVAGGMFTQFGSNPLVFMGLATTLFLILGCFMDPAPAMLIFVPVLAPIAVTVGVDPLQLGILVVMALAIGKITPPYGISLMLACSIAEIPLAQGMRWTIVFFVAFCLMLVVMIIFPELTLFLPKLLVPELVGR